MTTINFQEPTEVLDKMTKVASDFEKNFLKTAIGLGDFFEKFNQSNLAAIKHRKYLKEGAKLKAVGEDAKAEFYRKMAKDFGEKASSGYSDAEPIATALEKSLKNLIQTTGGLEKFIRSGGYRTAADELLENSIKPNLLSSSLPPYQISYMWRDINKFINDFEEFVRSSDGKLMNMPSLTPAQNDLDNVNYNDSNWDYCDKTRIEGEPQIKKEPIPVWKERIITVGRWVMVAVCVGIAILTCNWVAVFELIQQWMDVEETVREFCGWICA